MFKFLPYFKRIAELHPDILHSDTTEERSRFQRANGTNTIDEILLSQKGISNGHGIICIDNDSGVFGSNRNDSFIDTEFFTIAIWGKASEPDNFDTIEAVKRGNKKIFNDIRNKMVNDKYENRNGLDYLNISSIRYNSAGPVADNYFLLFVNFSLLSAAKICQVPSSLNFDV